MILLPLVGGVLTLWVGADLAVRGALGLARRWQWPSWLTGFLLLALGTSLPELFVSWQAAADHPALAMGNVFGSNVFNIGLVLGLVMLFAGKKGTTRPAARLPGKRELTIVGLVFFVFMRNGGLSPVLGSFALLIFLWILFRAFRKGSLEGVGQEEAPSLLPSVWSAPIMLLGFAFMFPGSSWTLTGALGLAAQVGWEDGLAGFFIAAAATSLPELLTCWRVVRHGATGAVYGNVLGSNIFNLLFVGGVVILLAGGIATTQGLILQAAIHAVFLLLFHGLEKLPAAHPRLLGLVILTLWVMSAVFLAGGIPIPAGP